MRFSGTMNSLRRLQLLLNRLEQFEQKLKLPLPCSKPSSASGGRRLPSPACDSSTAAPVLASRALKPAAEATSVQTDAKPRWRPSAKGEAALRCVLQVEQTLNPSRCVLLSDLVLLSSYLSLTEFGSIPTTSCSRGSFELVSRTRVSRALSWRRAVKHPGTLGLYFAVQEL
jgi:hypothetical protein